MEDGPNSGNAPIDPTYGQRTAIPDFYDEENESVQEALRYLLSVRSEASTIPHLLVTDEQPQQHDEGQSHLGYYEDGAYTGTTVPEEAGSDLSANQRAYYDTLLTHFAATRSKLARTPPSPLSAASPKEPSAILCPSRSHGRNLYAFQYTSPSARELAEASQETIMNGLKRYATFFNKRNFQQGEDECSHLGAWGWALLAKCREIGQLDSEDVSVIREVGKAACRLMIKTRAGMMSSMDSCEDGEIQDDIDIDIDEDGSTSQNGKTTARDSSIITALDILITIIGEEFRQRDLLETREIW